MNTPSRPTTLTGSLLLVLSSFVHAGCSSATEAQGVVDAGTSTSTANTVDAGDAGARPVDIQGEWLLCDVNAQKGGGSYDNGGGYDYVPTGGDVLDITVQHGVAAAVQVGGDGGPVWTAETWVDDAGNPCDGGPCSYTDVLLSGPFYAMTRVWSAGFAWTTPSYPARVTFSPDGNRFTGFIQAPDGNANIFGGRNDGAFTCAQGASGPSGSGGRCAGSPASCSSLQPPNCQNIVGCSLQIDVTTGDDTCVGWPSPCDGLTAPQECAQQGCTWGT